MAVSSVPRGAAASMRRNPAAAWRHLDVSLIGAVLAVASLGALMIFSATRRALIETGGDPHQFLKRQVLFIAVGLVAMAAVMIVDYRNTKESSLLVYGAVVASLVLVLTPLGSEIRGIRAWFVLGPFQIQPAEFAKLATIVAVAGYCAAHRGDLDGRRLIVSLVIAAVPMGLIYLQPDVGTMLVFVIIAMGMLLVAGAQPRHIAALTVSGIVVLGMALQTGFIELDDYQRDRFTAFIDPAGDVQRSSYNLDQAKTAIGGGGFAGAGLFQGTQTNLRYVPEQQTDFIFTVVGEELGFLGGGTLLMLYAIICWRIWRAAQVAKDHFGTLLCTGVLVMLLFHVFQNVGMTMGIMPITGIPLPLMSYGGSATIMTFMAIGLVLNVHMRRFS
jgi:rod shape determining protein RodA